MMNSNRTHSRLRVPGPRCVRCVRAKKGPCTGGKPQCDSCRAKGVDCVWIDQPQEEGNDTDNAVTYIEQRRNRRKRSRPSQNISSSTTSSSQTITSTTTTTSSSQTQADEDEPAVKSATKRQKPTEAPLPTPKRTKLVHTEVIRYKAERHTILVDDDPAHAPPHIDSYPADVPDRYRYPALVNADYAQATPLVQVDEPVTFYFPRLCVETEEVAIGPLGGEEEEWRRLAPGVHGGWMAWPGGRWVGEGEGEWRWVE
ncbi:hypothetical protein GJ744_002050 [Endocarpon pusillum]|uniref:Zn(2)-C6 fungal-type domain-containing protein n=1 Tax=Endocarpon pusillum TaxID=364733 RepID=A0A8H7A9G0_9EURO|nr:hypothetical protein GJ744_002050 [Endocarpon pusillum]